MTGLGDCSLVVTAVSVSWTAALAVSVCCGISSKSKSHSFRAYVPGLWQSMLLLPGGRLHLHTQRCQAQQESPLIIAPLATSKRTPWTTLTSRCGFPRRRVCASADQFKHYRPYCAGTPQSSRRAMHGAHAAAGTRKHTPRTDVTDPFSSDLLPEVADCLGSPLQVRPLSGCTFRHKRCDSAQRRRARSSTLQMSVYVP
jgi:hypothetical protein